MQRVFRSTIAISSLLLISCQPEKHESPSNKTSKENTNEEAQRAEISREERLQEIVSVFDDVPLSTFPDVSLNERDVQILLKGWENETESDKQLVEQFLQRAEGIDGVDIDKLLLASSRQAIDSSQEFRAMILRLIDARSQNAKSEK